ncbi:MAG TPA: hypothetical protein VFF30_04520 [Nitrososphaerales archaeon]|nr:hypothetical protein [Nitrososphaerales archaeon]
MRKVKKIPVAVGLSLVALELILSALILIFLPDLRLPFEPASSETIALLVSMGLIFFAAHPLGHFLVGLFFGVRTRYFFVAPSDFRKLDFGFARKLGGMLPTIGTKFDSSQLSSLGGSSAKRKRRGVIMGSGVIVSNALTLVPLVYAFALHFLPLALALGSVLFGANLIVELAFSTKVGDLYKMRREFATTQK